ncbi:MAG: hypothetical protein E4H20_01185 [Spirochaetales bacterium]|nr:MAG: hypothetical protein E4H20_01185 [Spirochaetales bacterium]
MKCDECGGEDSVFFIRQEGQPDERKLCRICAGRFGLVDTEGGLGARLESFLDGLNDDPAVDKRACPSCGMTISTLKSEGRLGCVHCVSAFRRDLALLWRRAGRTPGYVGKVPAGLAGTESPESLADDLQAAIQAEDFERAAALRDRLKRFGKEAGT